MLRASKDQKAKLRFWSMTVRTPSATIWTRLLLSLELHFSIKAWRQQWTSLNHSRLHLKLKPTGRLWRNWHLNNRICMWLSVATLLSVTCHELTTFASLIN